MPRVLHVIDDLAPGGAQTQLRLLAGASASRGDAITIAVGRYPGEHAERLVDRRIAVTWLGRRFGFDPFAARNLVATARRVRAEVIQSWDARSADLCQAARRWLPGCWVHTKREATGPTRWRADGFLLAHTRLSAPESSDPFEVVPNAIDPAVSCLAASDRSTARERLRAADVDVGGDAPIISAVMRMERSEPAKELAWAADLVRVVCPNLRFLVAGEGPGRAAAERFAAKACVPGTVVWLGHRVDIATLFAASDVVWCGRGIGVEPTPALEGMAAGKPLVIADGVGRRALFSGVPGVVAAPWNDRAGWATATRRLLDDPEKAEELGRGNAEWLGHSHEIDSVASRYFEALSRLVATRTAA